MTPLQQNITASSEAKDAENVCFENHDIMKTSGSQKLPLTPGDFTILLDPFI